MMDRMEQTIIYLAPESTSLATNHGYLALCKQVRHEVFVTGQGVSESIDFDGKDIICGHLLLLLGEEAVGTVRIRTTEQGTKLERIAVRSAYRGLHYGELLVRCALSIAALPVYIHAQIQREGFYKKLGFVVEDSTIFYEANIPHRTMIWPHGQGAAPCPITIPS
ncbi:MAG: GNAT family N-acetyltransferase [Sphaerochaetaceae bacterium]